MAKKSGTKNGTRSSNGKIPTKRKASYKVGDQVVYPHHGVATIEKIEDKDVLGKKKQYLSLIHI